MILESSLGSEPAGSSSGITIRHSMISDSPGDNEDGDEQDDDHAWFGSSKLVDGLQTPEPSFQTIQCRSKPGSPTGWGPAPNISLEEEPSGRYT